MNKVKEILCLHHSHLDIGYTHPQPLLLELQRDYIDEAIDLCLKTEHFPEESRFRWTCEATYPVLKWLETASEKQIDTFHRLLNNGQISIAALLAHTTPLYNAEQFIRSLYPVKELRDRFGIPINTAINHDINGQPWPMSQIMLDAGIDFYITGINIHFGGIPFERPAVFRWEAPDRRDLLTFQGEHYSLFNQFFETALDNTERMAQGIEEYVERLENNGYTHDFAFLTATNPPLYDNNNPDPALADLIRRYNEEGHEYTVRFVTPEILLEKIREIDPNNIPSHAGDWTDYWNFGSGSSARETRLTRKAKQGIKKAEFLESLQGSPGPHYDKVKQESILQASLYEEHTWGAAHSITAPDHPEVYAQRTHKSRMAYQAADLSAYVLGKQMEKLADNPLQSLEPEGVVVVNTSGVTQQVPLRIPDGYFSAGRHLSAIRLKQFLPYESVETRAKNYGMVELAPFSWRKIPLAHLQAGNDQTEQASSSYTVSEDSIETPYYHMTFDPQTGRILQVWDKQREWAMLNEESEWTLFEFVRESIDPLHNAAERTTFFPRDVDLANKSISVWNHDWQGKRTGAERVISWNIEKDRDTISFIMHLEAPGVRWLEQRITFSVHHPRIELTASLDKEDVREPESIYFAFPLNIREGWRSHYDSAGMFIELDHEQMGTVSKDWITVDRTVSVYDQEKGITLACPDAPLVQIGDFNFGKESKYIEREKDPVLLAWPMNNYWDTNFWIHQPGRVQFTYELTPFDEFNPEQAYTRGVDASGAVEMNMAISCTREESGAFFQGSGEGIVPLHIKPAEDSRGVIILLRNLLTETRNYRFSIPDRKIKSASIVNMLEEDVGEIEWNENMAHITLKGKELIQVRVVPEGEVENDNT